MFLSQQNSPPRILLAIVAMTSTTHAQSATLKDAFAEDFRVGVAIGTSTLMTPETAALALVSRQFNSATPENLLKWEKVHPARGRYDFGPSDRFVDFGEARDFFLVGHTLVWHSQTPDWVFKSPSGRDATRDELLRVMRDHISTVVGRYRGRIKAWDVVNEALNSDGSLRDSPWRRIIGDDYLEYAFRYAAEADPDAELYYNDYSMHLAEKRRGAVALATRLKQAGCRLEGIGMQGHFSINGPAVSEVEQSIKAYAQAAGKVMITEMDVNVLPWPRDHEGGADVGQRSAASQRLNPYVAGLPTDMQQRLADRYEALFRLFIRHRDVIDRVTFWGIDDGRSWHNGWPVRGRTAHSLLFDRALQPKPAFNAVLRTASSAQ